MSRFTCTCKKLITDTSSPAAHTAVMITDVALDAVSYDIDSAKQRLVMECPGCGRLWVETAPNTGRYVAFTPDTSRLDITKEGGGYRG